MTFVDPKTRFVDHEQPLIKEGLWVWPGSEGRKKKAVIGNFANSYCVVEDYKGAGDGDSNSAMDSLSGNEVMNGVRRAVPAKGAISTMWVLGMALIHCLI
mmetsp:Transcript_23716/g.50288  ORF Transcript_23716/g.50288 Transcript_23716/m.50288 type:complete len:100 (-) Transcript_23716:154-453(-)